MSALKIKRRDWHFNLNDLNDQNFSADSFIQIHFRTLLSPPSQIFLYLNLSFLIILNNQLSIHDEYQVMLGFYRQLKKNLQPNYNSCLKDH